MRNDMEYKIVHTTHFINGTWSQPSEQTFPNYNPYNGEVIAEISAGGREEAQAAIDAAQNAFPMWAKMPPAERQRLFLKAADITERRLEEIAHIMTVEAGTTKIFATFQIRLSAAMLRQAANWGYLPYGDVLRSDTPNRFAMVTRKPLGVVAGFTPWNGAFYLAWRTFILPMAFGNTTVIKPSEEAPLSAGLIHAEILEEAGFPAGTFNVVTHAPGAAGAIADAFYENTAVRCINFTGSDKTARIIGERAGRALKRTVFELGGFNPVIVLDDADLQGAVDSVVFGAFLHQGQVCMNARKVYVAQELHDEFVDKLVAKTQTLKAGDPLDPSVVIGPLINARAVEQIEKSVKEAVAHGATLRTGGKADGLIYEPTILTNVPQNAPCTTGCHETFGPLLVIQPFTDAEQALAEAQDTPYGLSASIMTGNEGRGLEMASRFDAGVIHVNGATIGSEAALPVGGVKDSGWGRSGYYAIEDFTEICLTTVTQGSSRYPF